MSAPLNNNIAAVAPEQFYQVYMPRVQLLVRGLLTLLALGYCWRLGSSLREAVLAGALAYMVAQALLCLLGLRLWGAHPALTLCVTALDVMAGLAIIANDPAPSPPSAVLIIGILGLAASQHRWPGYAALAGLILLLSGAALAVHQQWRHLPYDIDFYLLPLYLAGTAVVMLLLASQIEHLHHRTARIADIDELTGLGNRWTFYEAAKYLLPYRQRNLIPMVVMLADLELTEDKTHKLDRRTCELLARQFAAISEQRLRTSDVAVHYSDTTFAYLLIDTTLKDAESIASDLQQEFGRWARGAELPAQAHVGMATVPNESVALDQILMNISAAMHRSRQYKRGVAATVIADAE